MKPRHPSGLELIQREMARQHEDALASLEAARPVARVIAQAVAESRRLLLLGMGGSHFAARCAEVAYRRLGLDATALALSEVLYHPLPALPRATLLSSQSGESGEIVRYLETPPGPERRFGLTLNAHSRLAQAVPSLVGVGGPEVGFAATRSLMVSLALHGALLEALGERQEALRAVLAYPPDPDIAPAAQVLAQAKTVVFVGRGSLQGIAEMAALGLMELGRRPTLALEGGQFRHGPLEMLRPGVGLVFLKAGGPSARHTEELIAIARQAGLTPVVLDTSEAGAAAGSIRISLPPLDGLAAAAAALLPLQRLVLALAGRWVRRLGEPLRSSKVTREA